MKTKSLIKIGVALVLIAVVSVLALTGFQIGKYILMPVSDAVALDLSMGGGYSLTYQVADEDPAAVEGTLSILETRLDTLYPDTAYTRMGDNMIRVETESDELAPYLQNLLTTVGRIELTDAEGNVILTGADIDHAEINQNAYGMYYLVLCLTEEATPVYAEYTSSHLGSTVYLNLDGMNSHSFPIYFAVSDGRQTVSFNAVDANTSYAMAAELYTQLNLQEVPAAVSAVAVGEVTATAGVSAADKVNCFALIALAAAMAVMIVRYRLKGAAAAIALALFADVAVYAQATLGLAVSVSSFAGLLTALVAAVAMLSATLNAVAAEAAAGREGLSAVQFGVKASRMFSVDLFAVLAVAALFVMYFGSAEALHFGQAVLMGSVGALIANFVLAFFLRNFARIASDRAAA